MNAAVLPLIGFGQVRHTRLRPARNAFAYATYFLMLPLRSLHAGSDTGVLAHNRAAALSFFDSDPGARYVGEFAIGFNPHVLQPMRDILFDEKINGSFHFTPGQCYEETENGNRSQVHWDLVNIQREDYGGGTIHFDGKLIRENGRFVPKALQALNPERLK